MKKYYRGCFWVPKIDGICTSEKRIVNLVSNTGIAVEVREILNDIIDPPWVTKDAIFSNLGIEGIGNPRVFSNEISAGFEQIYGIVDGIFRVWVYPLTGKNDVTTSFQVLRVNLERI